MHYLKGDFAKFGVKLHDNCATFTFSTDTKDDCALLLFDKKTKKLLHKIEIPDECKIGKVCSVSVYDVDFINTVYLIERDGEITADEYANLIVGREKWNDKRRVKNDFATYCGIDSLDYSWTDNGFVPIEAKDLIIYKLHMRGYTMNHGLKNDERGTYVGLLNTIDDALDLGVNAIEFFPLYEFEEMEYVKNAVMDEHFNPKFVYEDLNKINYWGYEKASYFAPKAAYFGDNPSENMKCMIDKLHKRGVEVIMEISFPYNCDALFASEVLEFWAKEYHVDGFHVLGNNLSLDLIVNNPYLANTKIFAAEFPYELLAAERGNKHLFIYNDEFLYSLRQLQNHRDGYIAELANHTKRQNSEFGFVNYAANSNGFTLYDSFSYGEKHNEANGEDNRDGNNYNASNNYGIEGKTKNRGVNTIRLNNAKCAIAAVMLSQAIPLILSGDECMNSQGGNNNVYCQDNKIGWVEFPTTKAANELREFTKQMIAFRKTNPVLHLENPMRMNDYHHTGIPDLSYHSKEPWMMGIGNEKKSIAMLYSGEYSGVKKFRNDVLVCYNFHYNDEEFAIPRIPAKKKWFTVFNTASGFEETEIEEGTERVTVPGGTISVIVTKIAKKEKS